MIVAFSTSCPTASVALFTLDGVLLEAGEKEARFSAGAACLELLDELMKGQRLSRSEISGCLADLGPGSFTGTRSGVMLAKTLSDLADGRAGGIGSERLIHPTATVCFPSKRGEWFVFRGAEAPVRVSDLPNEHFVGFGPGVEPQTMPHARGFADVWDQIEWTTPLALVPRYWIDPSISMPKTPYREVAR